MREGTPIAEGDALTLTRASGKWAPDSAGVWHYFGPDTLARTNAGALIEPGGTNLIPNPGLAGAEVGIVGAGGSLPTGWYVNNTLTTEVLEITTLMGLPALRIRVSGVASGVFYELNMCPAATGITASTAYSASLFLQTERGTSAQVQLRQATAEDALTSVWALNGIDGSRYGAALTAAATAARGRLRATFALSVGQAIDSEFVLSWPQMEAGAQASSPVLGGRGVATALPPI